MANFIGSGAAETFLGTSSDDVFTASGGQDRIWGGTGGTDRLVLTGKMSDYSFRDNGDGSYAISDLRTDSPDGSIALRDIDLLAFSDGVRTLAQAKLDGVNVVKGTGGNDTLVGSSGRDELTGGAGDDRIWGSSAADVAVYSGRMSDYNITSNGDGSFTVTDMRGGAGDGTDIVRDVEQFRFSDGTASLSTFVTTAAATGVKTIAGGSGDDTLLGTAGNDVLIARGGNDRVWGGSGGVDTVVMSGRLADYAIKADANGSFTVTDLRGGVNDGIDIVRDVENFRFADQTASLDAFRAAYNASQNNTINGSNGNDVLLGTNGNDVILARGGNDRIWGGKNGQDTAVFSGKFSDYVVTDNGNGSLTLVDVRAGSPDGTDIVRAIDSFKFADKTLALSQVQSGAQSLVRTIDGTNGNDGLSGANTSGLSGANTNDLMLGNAGDDVLRGGAGNDLIIGDQAGSGASTISATGATATDLSNVQISLTTTGIVTFVGETAGFKNALGCYKVAADGQIYDVKVLFANASLAGSGGNLVAGQSSTSLDLQAGDKLGFFVVSNGFSQPGMASLLSDTAGTFKFVGPQGQPGNVGTTVDLKLVHVSTNGVETAIKSQYGTSVFHSTLGTNGGLNVDDITHVTGVTRYADGSIKIGFEDLLGGGDRDYDDSVFNLQIGTANAVLLGSGSTSGVSSQSVSGRDFLHGGIGADTLMGGAGHDVLEGGDGADLLLGGDGRDAADYSRAATGVSVDLESGGTSGEAAGDTYASIEMVLGSAQADDIRGTSLGDVLSGLGGDDVLTGRAGDDVLRGGAGADILQGGDGFDTATYYDAAEGVVVNLADGVGSLGDAEGDVLSSIERVQGSDRGGDLLIGGEAKDELQGYGGDDSLFGAGGDDVLGGGTGDDNLFGGSGDDLLVGGEGADLMVGGEGADTIRSTPNSPGVGVDTIDGGDGIDLLDYSASNWGVLIDLAAGVGGAFSNSFDTISNIENATGSNFSDVIWGSDLANRLSGGTGNDSIRGGSGDDVVLGMDGNDILFGDHGDDIISGGAGFDRAIFENEMASYEIARLAEGNWRISDISADGSDGTDIVFNNVEQLVFANATYDLQSGAINGSMTAYDYLFVA